MLPGKEPGSNGDKQDTIPERTNEEGRILEDRVELDDTYLGGERRGGKVGRGSENKVPFLAAIQTDMNHHPRYVYSLVSRLFHPMR
jgi:hypothetical protein